MEFIKASELSFDPRPQMGEIFSDGFYELGLKFICKDKAKLARALAHAFVLDEFYLAVQGNEIASFIARTNGKPPIKLDKKILRMEMGFFHGSFTYFILNKTLANHKYPFEIHQNMGVIEFVATAANFRGKGIAGQLMEFVMDAKHYDKFVLEVADTNTSAIKLYTRLGFVEFKRTPAPKLSGFKFFIYMNKNKR